MDVMTEKLGSKKNFLQAASGTIASISLEQAGRRVAGALVTPVTWGVNFLGDRSKPSIVDTGIYTVGFASAPASVITGIWKGAMDDDTNQKLSFVRSAEPEGKSSHIFPCSTFGSSAPQINAMCIAREALIKSRFVTASL